MVSIAFIKNSFLRKSWPFKGRSLSRYLYFFIFKTFFILKTKLRATLLFNKNIFTTIIRIVKLQQPFSIKIYFLKLLISDMENVCISVISMFFTKCNFYSLMVEYMVYLFSFVFFSKFCLAFLLTIVFKDFMLWVCLSRYSLIMCSSDISSGSLNFDFLLSPERM